MRVGGAGTAGPGNFEPDLTHVGNLAFIPTGAEAVRIYFSVADGKAQSLIIEDGPVVVRVRPV